MKLPVLPSDPIACERLHATLPAKVCVARQRSARVDARIPLERRASVSSYSARGCYRCPDGEAVAEALGEWLPAIPPPRPLEPAPTECAVQVTRYVVPRCTVDGCPAPRGPLGKHVHPGDEGLCREHRQGASAARHLAAGSACNAATREKHKRASADPSTPKCSRCNSRVVGQVSRFTLPEHAGWCLLCRSAARRAMRAAEAASRRAA